MDELWCECDIQRKDDVLQFLEFRPQNIFMVQMVLTVSLKTSVC